MKYQTRVNNVDSIQWTARNLDVVRTICPDAYAIDSGWTLAIPIPEDRRIVGVRNYLVAHVGYYVVRTKAGLCFPMKPTDFEAAYEVAQSEQVSPEPSPCAELVTEFGRSLRKEQVGQLIGFLDMTQKVLFTELMGHAVATVNAQGVSSIEKLLEEFGDPEYTQEQFNTDRARLLAVLSAKHGVPESEVDTLIREHRYTHSAEDPEDEYIGIMAMARVAGWL